MLLPLAFYARSWAPGRSKPSGEIRTARLWVESRKEPALRWVMSNAHDKAALFGLQSKTHTCPSITFQRRGPGGLIRINRTYDAL